MKSYVLWSSAALLLTVTGCSNGTSTADHKPASASVSTASSTRSGATIQVTDFSKRTLAFQKVPQHIVALSNGDLDIIYALGGTAVGRPNSNGPAVVAAAENVQQIGSTHEVDLEKITMLKPDVVLGNYPMNEKDIPAIEGVGSQLLLTGANSVHDIQSQITLFGQLLQKQAQAVKLNQQIDQQVTKLQKETASASKPKVLLVYGAPATYMAALPNSLSGNILEAAGGSNIAADFPGLQNFPQYAQLNTERIIQADPDYIFIMTHGNTEDVKAAFIKEMQENAAWNGIRAVKNNQVEVLPSDLFGTNPGTRVTKALDLMHQKLYPAK
ncbi:ABC transporter substrate-binding protein [Paenibacillus polymyxa]|uniref:ABC transporter substrate-binding protein n=1 Tax=Paenibacillus polymyxa TaxID=1406 RepID=UPI002AB38955|nr:ABC transporter substrate-binding protein [Paenibacillus polymyxa]MDY7993249.1 ABC transporter substrate-binding protein [Paenibacillus polymyxa]MDY8119231.1 ABC transporter substrate-binding protein [Paenibacillus polymyxa]